jgi:hypothetical protein
VNSHCIHSLQRAGRCDLRGGPIDLAPTRELLERIARTWHAEQIWLFGTRARGEARR